MNKERIHKFRPGKKITDLFTEELWNIDLANCSRGYRNLVSTVRVVRVTIDEFFSNKMGFQCVALSYFTLLALVPLLGLIFAVCIGLGMPDNISTLIFKMFPANVGFAELIIQKASEFLDNIKGGGTGMVSALLFLWAVIWLMFQVERVFNNVWGISHIPRKIYKRFGYYIIIMLLIPFIVIIFGTGIAFYTNLPNLFGLDVSNLRLITVILGYLIFYVVTAFTLSAMYTFIPATRVRYRHALKASAFAAIAFVMFQYLYLEAQLWVGRLNNVYGVIAALPFFLIWMNISWQIIIYGASLTYGFQYVDENVKSHEWESDSTI